MTSANADQAGNWVAGEQGVYVAGLYCREGKMPQNLKLVSSFQECVCRLKGANVYRGIQATLLSQPENDKVYSLCDYVAVGSETNDCFMCVISEMNDPSKEVKVRFMRKSGQHFLLSKKLEKWFPKSAIFHRCSVPSIDNSMHYSLMPSILKVYVIN